MKRVWLSLVLAGAFCLPSLPAAAAAAPHDFVTGQDWTEHMSEREKYIALVPPAILFSEYDIHTKLSLPQYIFLMDKVMERNPHLLGEEVSSIFASTVYHFEPETRPALREMEMDFLRGDIADMPLTRVRLRIEDVLPEAFAAED